jgi:hypothetical protein
MDLFVLIFVLFLGALVGIGSVLIFCAALAAFQEK